MLSSPRAIFDLWPKPRIETVSDDFRAAGLNISSTMVSKWAQRGRVPPEYWRPLVKIAADRGIRGVTFDALLSMHSDIPPERVLVEARA